MWNSQYECSRIGIINICFEPKRKQKPGCIFIHNFLKSSLADGRNKIYERKYNSFCSLLMSQLNGTARLLFHKMTFCTSFDNSKSVEICVFVSGCAFQRFYRWDGRIHSIMESFLKFKLTFLASIAIKSVFVAVYLMGTNFHGERARKNRYVKIICCHYAQHHMRITTILFRFFIRNWFIIYLAFIWVSIYFVSFMLIISSERANVWDTEDLSIFTVCGFVCKANN